MPLAIVQAAGFMAETGMPAAQYLDLLRPGPHISSHGDAGVVSAVVGGRTQLIIDRLAEEDPAAAELASLCAFLAPEPIPQDLFTVAVNELPVSWQSGQLTCWLGGDPSPSGPPIAGPGRPSRAGDAPAYPGHPP